MCEASSDEWQTPKASEFDSMESLNSCIKRLEYDSSPKEFDNINAVNGLTKELVNQMNDLTIKIATKQIDTIKCTNGTVGDGNDSGVDTGIITSNPNQLQRALSNNSAGYASSSGGLDVQFTSCNSSLLSICSDSNDGILTVVKNVDCTSENGSESSSVSGDKLRTTAASVKKRIGVMELPQIKSMTNKNNENCKSRGRTQSANRISACNRGPTNSVTIERARSRDKSITSNSIRKISPNRRPKTLATQTSKDAMTPSPKGSTLKRTASVTRRTPTCTPSNEDGRWPSNITRSSSKVRTTTESLVIKTKAGPILLENNNKLNTERFSSMSRNKRSNSNEDLNDRRFNRSISTTRDQMTSSTIVRRLSTRETRESPHKSHPSRNSTAKTIIYHEAAIQTAITSQDIDDAFAGHARDIRIDAVQMNNRECQVDIRDKEIEQLNEKLDKMKMENVALQKCLGERSQYIVSMEQQLTRERDEKITMEKELQSNTKRISALLAMIHTTSTCNSASAVDSTCDSLLMLESQIQLSGHILEEKQFEINTLRQFCKELQNRSQQVQQNLLEERKCFEKETNELQDFLQDEKTAIVEALKDAETEIEQYQVKLEQKDTNIERLQDECRHLVRICEQRR